MSKTYDKLYQMAQQATAKQPTTTYDKLYQMAQQATNGAGAAGAPKKESVKAPTISTPKEALHQVSEKLGNKDFTAPKGVTPFTVEDTSKANRAKVKAVDDLWNRGTKQTVPTKEGKEPASQKKATPITVKPEAYPGQRRDQWNAGEAMWERGSRTNAVEKAEEPKAEKKKAEIDPYAGYMVDPVSEANMRNPKPLVKDLTDETGHIPVEEQKQQLRNTRYEVMKAQLQSEHDRLERELKELQANAGYATDPMSAALYQQDEDKLTGRLHELDSQIDRRAKRQSYTGEERLGLDKQGPAVGDAVNSAVGAVKNFVSTNPVVNTVREYAQTVTDRLVGTRDQINGMWNGADAKGKFDIIGKVFWGDLFEGSARFNKGLSSVAKFLFGGVVDELHALTQESVNLGASITDTALGTDIGRVDLGDNVLERADDYLSSNLEMLQKAYEPYFNSSRGTQWAHFIGSETARQIPSLVLGVATNAVAASAATSEGLAALSAKEAAVSIPYYNPTFQSEALKGLPAAVANGVSKLVNDPQFTTAWISALDESLSDAEENGLDKQQTMIYSVINSVWNAMLEVGGVDEALGGVQGFMKSAGKGLRDSARSIIQEGTEEVEQGSFGRYLMGVIKGDAQLFSLDPNDTDAAFNPTTNLSEFVGGAAVAAGMTSAQNVINTADYGAKKGAYSAINAIYKHNYKKAASQFIDSAMGEMVTNVEAKKVLVDGYSTTESDPVFYAKGVEDTMKLAKMGLEPEQIREVSTFAAALSETQFNHAYELTKSGQSAVDIPDTYSPSEKPLERYENIESYSATFQNDAAKVTEIYEMAPETDVNDFAQDFQKAYDMGRVGVSGRYLSQDSSLSQKQAQAAYQLGSETAWKDAKSSTPVLNVPGKTRRIGTVSAEAGVSLKTLRRNFNDSQRVAYKMLSNFAKVTGINIRLYESKFGKDGKNRSANGWFDPKTNTIHIDINSGVNAQSEVGDLSRYVMHQTLAHELTHFTEKWNAEAYYGLRQAVLGLMEQKGVDVNALIEETIARNQAVGNNLDYEGASREVVADSMADMFSDSTVVEQLANQNPTLFQKVLERLREIRDQFKALIQRTRGMQPQEAKLLQENGKYLDELVALWEETVKGAVNAYQAGTEAEKPKQLELKGKAKAKQSESKVVEETSKVGETASEVEAKPEEHIDQRSFEDVADRKMNAFQFDHPELRPFFKQAAEQLRKEIEIAESAAYMGTGKNVYRGPYKRLYNYGMSKPRILECLDAIIHDHGQENFADAKRVEIVLDQMLSERWGGMGATGEWHEPNQAYLEAKQKIAGASGEYGDTSLDALWEPGKQFSVRKDDKVTMQSPVVGTKRFLALHNLTADKMRSTLKLGGWPSPSIAIVDAKEGHTAFGEFSVLFGRDTIDPEKDSRNKVYGSDAWTPTSAAARVEYEVNYEQKRNFENRINELDKKVAGGIFSNSSTLSKAGVDEVTEKSVHDIAEKISRYPEVKAAYLADQGRDIEVQHKEKQYNRYFGNEVLRRFIDKVGEQRLAEARANLRLGGSIEEAVAGVKDDIVQTSKEAYEEEHRNFLNRREERVPGMKQKAIDKWADEKLTVFYLEDWVNDAWEFYQNGAQSSEEVDRLATENVLDDTVSAKEVSVWAEEQLNGLLGEPGIYNGKDIYTSRGDRRSFSQTHWEYTAENIVRAMNMDSARGAGMYGASGSGILATATPEYKSVAEMHADEGRLHHEDQGEYEAAKDALNDALIEVTQDIQRTTKHHADNSYEEGEIIGDVIMQAASKLAAGGKRTVANVQQIFRKADYAISTAQAQKILDMFDMAAKVPTGYYEAKPGRVVGFDEAVVVAAPDNTSEALLNQMIDAGMNVVTYAAGDDAERMAIMNEQGVQFSLRPGAREDVHKALTDKHYHDDVHLTDSSPAIITNQKGTKNLPMVMNPAHLRENILTEEEAKKMGLVVNKHKHYHGLGETRFLAVIDGLDEVEYAFRGTKTADNPARRENYFLLISQQTDEAGNTINVPVYINEQGQYNRVFVHTNRIATVFGRDNYMEYLNREVRKGNLVRITNKKRSTQASERTADNAAGYSKNASIKAPLVSERTAPVAAGYNQNASDINVAQKQAKSKTQNENQQFSIRTEAGLPVYNDRALLKDETIEKYLKDYASSNPKYAQAYIAYMSPRQFLKLTTKDVVSRINIQKESTTLDPAKLAETNRQQPLFLTIDAETGEVYGHEGRHRMVALERAGVTRVPVLLFDSASKYSKTPMESLMLNGQFNEFQVETVNDLLPLSREYADEIRTRFSEKTRREQMAENYQGKETLEYQIRRTAMSDEQLLTHLVDTMGAPSTKLTAEEQRKLKVYRHYREQLDKSQKARAALGSKLHEQYRKSLKNTPEIAQTKAEIKRAEAAISYNEQHLEAIRTDGVIDKLINKARRQFDAEMEAKSKRELKEYREIEKLKRDELRDRLTQEGRERLTNYRNKRNESEAVRHYREQVAKRVKELRELFLHPSTKDIKKHIPKQLEGPLMGFLESIDLSSKRLLDGGEMTKADARVLAQMHAVREALNTSLDEGGLDLPPDFKESFDGMIGVVTQMLNDSDGSFVVNRMNSAQLKELSRQLKVLKKAVTSINVLHNNGRFAHVAEAGHADFSFLGSFRRNTKSSEAARFINFDYIRPTRILTRMGEGAKSIGMELRQGQATEAFLTKEILDFKEKTFTDKEAEAWGKEVHTFKLENGESVTMTSTQLMSLYCLSKRKQAQSHIYGQGISVGTFKDGKVTLTDDGHQVTLKDVGTMLEALTERQKTVADALQKFMNTEAASWGNYVSMARFDVEMFTEENYFPISVDKNALPAQGVEEGKGNDLYALLNMGFTKELKENASERVKLFNVFDVFGNHVADMAQYRAFALPVLDAVKWFNYRDASGLTLRDQMDKAFGVNEKGVGYAQTAIKNLLKAYNSKEAQGQKYDSLGMKWLSRFNGSRVAWNLRVVVQQPTAIARAAMVINGKYLTAAVAQQGNLKADIAEMEANSGIALWKSYGFFDTNISRNIVDMIRPNDDSKIEKARQTFTDVGLTGAEWGDKITWATMWRAAKMQVAAEAKAKGQTLTQEQLLAKTTELFEDCIYDTQVVDSVLTKSEFLRSKSIVARTFGSFMSEASATVSMVQDVFLGYSDDMARGMSRQAAWVKHKGKIAKVMTVYTVTEILNTIAQSLIDGLFRDDDDYESKWEKVWSAFKTNFIENLMPFGKIPGASELFDAFKWLLDKVGAMKPINRTLGTDFYGQLDGGELVKSGKYVDKFVTTLVDLVEKGEKSKYSGWRALYSGLQLLGVTSGFAVDNIYRSGVNLWNASAAELNPALKIRQMNNDEKTRIKYAYLDGNLDAEKAIDLLVEKEEAKNQNEAYWMVQGWDGASKYDEVKETALAGDLTAFANAMDVLTEHGVKQKDAQSKVKNFVKAVYTGEFQSEKDEEIAGDTKLSDGQAKNILVRFAGLNSEEADDYISDMKFYLKNGYYYDNRKSAYLNGEISRTQVKNALMGAGNMTAEEAEAQIAAWEWNEKYHYSGEVSSSMISYYNEFCKDAGVSAQTYLDVKEFSRKNPNDKNEKGQSIAYSGAKKVAQYINSLNLTREQKEALAQAMGWKSKTLKKVRLW